MRYPGGPVDAEALLADPRTGRLFIVTKLLLGAEIYAVPAKAGPGPLIGSVAGGSDKVWTLERFGSAESSLVTDGAFLPDGRVLLRSYGGLTLLAPPAGASEAVARMTVLGASRVPDQKQGEGLAVVDAGRTALLGSEGAGQAILRVPVPRVPPPNKPPLPRTTVHRPPRRPVRMTPRGRRWISPTAPAPAS